MAICCVVGCRQRHTKGIHMHQFPNKKKFPDRYKQWKKACGDPNLKEAKPFVCCKHFDETQYDPSYIFKLNFLGPGDKLLPRPVLSDTAVPTLFLPEEFGDWSDWGEGAKKKRKSEVLEHKFVPKNEISHHSDVADDTDISTLDLPTKSTCVEPPAAKILKSTVTQHNFVPERKLLPATHVPGTSISTFHLPTKSTCVKPPAAKILKSAVTQHKFVPERKLLPATHVPGTTISTALHSNKLLESSYNDTPVIQISEKKTYASIGVQCAIGVEALSCIKPSTDSLNTESNMHTLLSDSDLASKAINAKSVHNPNQNSDMSDDSDSEENEPEGSSLKYPNGCFIISAKCLESLFNKCQLCGSDISHIKMCSTGTMCSVRSSCIAKDCKPYVWISESANHKQTKGNVQVSVAAVLCGMPFSTLCQFSEILKLHMISPKIHNNFINKYIEPTVNNVYEIQRKQVYQNIVAKGVVRLAGDGEFAGHKYSSDKHTYTLQDVDTSLIVNFVVSKNKDMQHSSSDLEKDSFLEIFSSVTSELPVKIFTSDRYPAIQNIMKTKFSHIKHEYDLWNVVKGLNKEIIPLFRKYKILSNWKNYITNHLWWSAISSEGDRTLFVDKFQSIVYHIINKHQWEGGDNNKLQSCEHGTLTSPDSTVWLRDDDEAYAALKKVVCSPNLVKNTSQVAENIPSGELEVFHSICNKYMPKRVSFTYKGVVLRTQIAVLDYNSCVRREWTRYDNQHYSEVSGKCVVRKRFAEKSDKWREQLVCRIVESASKQKVPQQDCRRRKIQFSASSKPP